jgi:hypothetical protein
MPLDVAKVGRLLLRFIDEILHIPLLYNWPGGKNPCAYNGVLPLYLGARGQRHEQSGLKKLRNVATLNRIEISHRARHSVVLRINFHDRVYRKRSAGARKKIMCLRKIPNL